MTTKKEISILGSEVDLAKAIYADLLYYKEECPRLSQILKLDETRELLKRALYGKLCQPDRPKP